jgi:hypothetical protein
LFKKMNRSGGRFENPGRNRCPTVPAASGGPRWRKFFAAIERREVILENASAVLRDEFSELAIRLRTPDEKDKRHGQAAASLPTLE